jgi:phenylalanyl-tRNA synthetase beta chain
MPVLKFRIDRLLRGLESLSLEELREALFRLRCETEVIDDIIEVEVNPDRPDMYSREGIHRAVKGLLGIERGWSAPKIVDSGIIIRAGNVPSRPYIAGAVIYNVEIEDDNDLEEIIQFQEKLHDTLGRRRRKVAIGIHDLSKLPSPTLSYRLDPLERVSFPPLGSNQTVSGWEALRSTEQGEKYGRISLVGDAHPFLYSGEHVIAMPPVINSNITRLEPGTKSVFIDVTGTDERTVLKTLDILVSNLAERKHASIGRVDIVYEESGRRIATPLLEEKQLNINTGYASQVLGYNLNTLELAKALGMMRYNILSMGYNSLSISVPPFRIDIISLIDLIEDVAIALGYDTLYPLYKMAPTRGKLLDEIVFSRRSREILIGLGFTEVLQLMLTSPKLVGALELKAVEIENPVQLEYSVLRPSLAVSLLSVLSEAQHSRKPVRIFEIGDVVVPLGSSFSEKLMLGLAYLDDEVSVENIQAPLYAYLEIVGARVSVEEDGIPPYLIEGRSARVRLESGEKLGYFGEVHPRVLERLGIEYPVALAEVDLEVLARWRSKTRNPE